MGQSTNVLDVNLGLDLENTVISFVLTFSHVRIISEKIENDLVEFGEVVFQFFLRRVRSCTTGISARLWPEIEFASLHVCNKSCKKLSVWKMFQCLRKINK